MAYYGHRSWNAWNVYLWMSNDEALYRMAMDCLRRARTLDRATELFMDYMGGETTPDGANFNKTSVREALSALRD